MNIFLYLRQLRFPREFRISASPWPSNIEQLLLRIEQTLREFQELALGEQEFYFIADISTGLWRLKQKMVKPGTNQPLEEMQRAYRHLESVWDALTQAGAEIMDYTNNPFDAGMSLKVIAYQPVPGLERERVIETIKPTVYFRGKQIQMGEVIVGRPEKGETPSSNPNNALKKV